jgi:hypothetical protein
MDAGACGEMYDLKEVPEARGIGPWLRVFQTPWDRELRAQEREFGGPSGKVVAHP